jgi:hypothetical protein
MRTIIIADTVDQIHMVHIILSRVNCLFHFFINFEYPAQQDIALKIRSVPMDMCINFERKCYYLRIKKRNIIYYIIKTTTNLRSRFSWK